MQVHVVEGNPACAEWIYEQLRANALGNVRLHAMPARAGASHCRGARAAAAAGDSGGDSDGTLVELVADVTAEVRGRTGPSPALALVLPDSAGGGADGDAGALGVWAAAVLAAGQAPRLVVAANAPRMRQVRVGRPSQRPVGSRGNAVGRATKAVASRWKALGRVKKPLKAVASRWDAVATVTKAVASRWKGRKAVRNSSDG
jgi:hypothetical protein